MYLKRRLNKYPSRSLKSLLCYPSEYRFPVCFSTSDPSIFGFYCIQAGAKVNVSAGGATPLHIAADNGSLELINSLLKAGTDPNVSDEVRHI